MKDGMRILLMLILVWCLVAGFVACSGLRIDGATVGHPIEHTLDWRRR